MTFIPDQISADSLQSLLLEKTADGILDDLKKEAAVEKAKADEHLFDGLTEEQVIDHAANFCGAALDECHDPMVHKLMGLQILQNFISWHEAVAFSQGEDGNIGSSIGWAEDLGKLKTAYELFKNISLGDNDFTVDHDCCHD